MIVFKNTHRSLYRSGTRPLHYIYLVWDVFKPSEDTECLSNKGRGHGFSPKSLFKVFSELPQKFLNWSRVDSK